MTALVKKVHDTVKTADPTLRFGISPQGNPDNDLNSQYSDVTAWLAAGGEEQVVDYLCPQIYWGYGYTLQSGSTRFAFENIVPAWLAYPRAEGVALYFGLGAYRVGAGDGGANPDSVSGWSTGDVLARQVQDLRSQNAGGWALYRYGSLFGAGAPEQAAAECAALRAVTGKETVKSGGKPHKKSKPAFFAFRTAQDKCLVQRRKMRYTISVSALYKNRAEG